MAVIGEAPRSVARLTGRERKDRILSAATKVFSRSGFSNATTRELARTAGVTEPTLYLHFANKMVLFEAVVARCRERRLARLAREAYGRRPLREVLHALYADAECWFELSGAAAATPEECTEWVAGWFRAEERGVRHALGRHSTQSPSQAELRTMLVQAIGEALLTPAAHHSIAS